MPPEQILGSASIDRRADIFAVGVILWEAVAGRRMWEGKSEVELFRGLASGVLPNLREFAPDAPESIVRIVERATAIDPEHRFANALEMLSAIEEASAKEGLLTRPQELAAFMATHFGQAREEEQTQIRAALRGEPDSGAIELTSSRQRLVASAATSDFARETAEPMELHELQEHQSSRTFRVRQRRWGIVLAIAAAAALLLVGSWAIRRSPSSTASAAEPVQPKTVMIEVQALPPGAEIFLDGKRLGSDRFVGALPQADRKVSLEVRANGHLSERKELALTRDMSLQFVLAPDPAVQAASASAAIPDSSARLAQTAVRATKKRLPQCNPPYVFAADGVKTYKPECF
jgi:serine/threonine-protein kinase